MKKFTLKLAITMIIAAISLLGNSTVFAQNPGSVDQSFTQSGFACNNITAICPLRNGKSLIGAGNNPNPLIVRLNSDGSLDNSFNTGVGITAVDIDTLGNGTIVLKSYDSQNPAMSALNFVTSDNDSVLMSVVNPNINIASHGLTIISSNQFSPSPGFDFVAYSSLHEIYLVNTTTLQQNIVPFYTVPNNGVVLNFKVVNNKMFITTNRGLIKVTLGYPTADLSNILDLDFNNNVSSAIDTSNLVVNPCEINSFGVLNNGSVLIGGRFKLMAGFQEIYIAKFDSLGNIDNSFTSLPDNVVHSILVQSNDKVLIAGNFSSPKVAIACINSDGTSNLVFNNNLGSAGDQAGGRTLSIQNDGNLLIGGYFTSVDGHTGHIVRLFGEQSLVENICLASVDSVGHSQIVWEKIPTTNINYYKIYKFGVGGWNAIDSVPYSNYSVYIDQNSNQTNAEKYKMSAVDTLGVESVLTNSVTTIFLQQAAGSQPNDINLDWTPGEGFEILYYRILRLDMNNLDILIDSLPYDSSVVNYTYTEHNVPQGLNTYVIEAVSTANCSPSLADGTGSAQKSSGSFGSSRSNPIHVISTGIQSSNNLTGEINVFPNPTNGLLSIKYNLLKNAHVSFTLSNITGEIVMQSSKSESAGSKTVILDLSNTSPGFYFLKVSSQNTEKVIKVAKN